MAKETRGEQNGCQSCSQCYARGHYSPLRPTFPPLRTPCGFACSVASLSRCPHYYQQGCRNFRHAQAYPLTITRASCLGTSAPKTTQLPSSSDRSGGHKPAIEDEKGPTPELESEASQAAKSVCAYTSQLSIAFFLERRTARQDTRAKNEQNV